MAEFRVFVEKKVNFATEAKKLKENLQVVLGTMKYSDLWHRFMNTRAGRNSI